MANGRVVVAMERTTAAAPTWLLAAVAVALVRCSRAATCSSRCEDDNIVKEVVGNKSSVCNAVVKACEETSTASSTWYLVPID